MWRCKAPHPLDHRYYPDVLDDVREVIQVERDQEIAEDTRVLLMPGHTPGGQSVLVNTRTGKALITGFCCNDRNFPERGRPIPPGVHTDAVQAYESTMRARREADILIPIHDVGVGRRHRIPG